MQRAPPPIRTLFGQDGNSVTLMEAQVACFLYSWADQARQSGRTGRGSRQGDLPPPRNRTTPYSPRCLRSALAAGHLSCLAEARRRLWVRVVVALALGQPQ